MYWQINDVSQGNAISVFQHISDVCNVKRSVSIYFVGLKTISSSG